MYILPTDIVYIICSFDYRLLRLIYHWGFNIQKPDCSYLFLRYLVKHNDLKLFHHCIKYIEHNEEELRCLFDLSVIYSSIDIVRELHMMNIITNEDIFEYCIYSIQENLTECINFFVKETDIDLQYNDYQIICEAIRVNNHNLVQQILDDIRVEDPSDESNSVLITSIICQNKKIFTYLVNHPKIEVHQPDNEPFRIALEIGNKWFVNKLMSNPYVIRTLQLDYEEYQKLHMILE